MIGALWNIPRTWIWTEIKDLGEIVSGGTPSTKELAYWGDEVNWISPSDLTGYQSKTIAKGAKNLTLAGLKNSSAKVMPAGSVHFSSRAPIGYVAISSQPICTNQGFKSLVPSDGIFNEYAYYYLKASKYLAEERATGTTFKEISSTAFGQLPLPLPPLNEQKRIVAKIEELFSKLDSGIESLKTARAQLKIYRQSVLKHAFEGKLTAAWREKNKVSNEWKPVKLGEIIKVFSGKNLTAKQMREGSYPVYGGNGINGYHDECNVSEKKLIIGRVGVKCGVTHITEEKCWVTDNALIVNFLVNNIDMNFFEKRLGYENLNKLSASTAQPVISGSRIYAVEMLLPSLEEQRHIASAVDHFTSVAEKLENTIDTELQKSEALRHSILKKAFSGQIVAQNPADEPASALLARIRTEKSNAQLTASKPKEKRRAA